MTQKEATGFRVFIDGNAWCAVASGFTNIQESPCGFGETPQLAYDALIFEMNKNSWWRHQPDFPPQYDKFEVEP